MLVESDQATGVGFFDGVGTDDAVLGVLPGAPFLPCAPILAREGVGSRGQLTVPSAFQLRTAVKPARDRGVPGRA
jgi:hypothetical protein